MKIFHNIEIRNNNKTIIEAVSAILMRAEELHFVPHKWSLAELHMDNEDYEWLCHWVRNLHENTVQSWLEESSWRTIRILNHECSYAAAFGTLLLLFTSETARRKATEGGLWITFQRECFHNATLQVLFVQGQPKRTYKDALEAAARWLQIRHVFGIEGLQSWFDTVHLQFGFSYQGFLQRLPEWLVGQGKTQAMLRLLDGPMRSETFCRLWDALRNIRRKHITVEHLKKILVNNCWVLPEWVDDLAIQAVARIELGQGSETNGPLPEDAFEPLLDQPLLRWDDSDKPKFVCHLVGIARFGLSEETYFVEANGHRCTRLQRNSDGMYAFHPSEEIVFSAAEPLQVVALVSSTGTIIDNTVVTLWSSNDEITAFRASSGKALNCWLEVMRPESAYFLITAPDLKLLPEPTTWVYLDRQKTRVLSLLNQGWSAALQIQLNGQTFWQPNTVNLATREEPRWANAIDVLFYPSPKETSFKDFVQAWIRHPKGTVISFIRLGSQAINFSDEDEENSITEQIMIVPDMLVHGSNITSLCFTLGVRQGTILAILHRSVTIPVVGALTISQEGWVDLNSKTVRTVEQIKTLPIQILRSHIKQFALLESDVFIGRPHHTPHPLGTLSGLGASVKLRQGPYNATEKDSILIREVVDTGLVASIEPETDITNTTLTIHLLRPIELDQKHQIVIWNDDATVHVYNQENTRFSTQPLSWSLQISTTITQPLVVAIAYDGIRLGAWWHQEWCSVLDHAVDVEIAAVLLRWFQLPLLSNNSIRKIKHFVSKYASKVLPIWLADVSPINDKQWSATDDFWLSAVRVLFKQWIARDMSARQLVSKLGGDSIKYEELLLNTAWRLARVDPLLMGKTVKMYIENVCLPQSDVVSIRKMIDTILSAFTGHERNTDATLRQSKKALLEEIATTMGDIDTNFIHRRLIEPAVATLQGKVLAELEENNLALSLHIEPFRRLLAISLLEKIAQTIGTGR